MITDNPTFISVSRLPRRLAELTGKPSQSYNWLMARFRDGRLPAVCNDTRWYVRTADLAVIAAMIEHEHASNPNTAPEGPVMLIEAGAVVDE